MSTTRSAAKASRPSSPSQVNSNYCAPFLVPFDIRLFVTLAPLSASIEPQVQTVDYGRPATLTCNPEGNPIKSISWMKDGVALSHSDNVLRIEQVRREDKGMYQCFVRNDQESAQASAELKLGGRCKSNDFPPIFCRMSTKLCDVPFITVDPPQFLTTFTERTLQPGPSVSLKCSASGNPLPEITWELDGKKLSSSERYTY